MVVAARAAATATRAPCLARPRALSSRPWTRAPAPPRATPRDRAVAVVAGSFASSADARRARRREPPGLAFTTRASDVDARELASLLGGGGGDDDDDALAAKLRAMLDASEAVVVAAFASSSSSLAPPPPPPPPPRRRRWSGCGT